MKIRHLLFIVIPLLFIALSAISLLLFNSSHRVNESYAQFQARLLLYETINEQAQQSVKLADQWLNYRQIQLLSDLQDSSAGLAASLEQAQNDYPAGNAVADALSLQQLIISFQQIEQHFLSTAAEEDTLLLRGYLDEAQQLASFISQECYTLIGLELSSYQDRYNIILQQVANMRVAGIVLLLSMLLLSLWLAYIISKSISTPIQQLVTTAEGISQGNLDQQITQYHKKSDFYSLANAFTHMQTALKEQIATEKQALEKDKQLKEMELEVLKSQINPHFLFNSLNVVSKLALIEGAEQTSDLTVAISNLLRYNLKQLDTPVPLRDEVKHANDYVYIQQARYRDRVQFQLDIDQNQLDTTVPVLTLQPILENIFVHGIEQLEHGARITLRIYGDDQYTWITISDNGKGMDEETVEQLLQYQQGFRSSKPAPTGQSTGLGTHNVFRRLQLLYGDQHGVEIESRLGEGTAITLRIPRGV